MQKAKRALMYPSFVVVVAVIVVLVLVTMVLPPLLEMFEVMDAELPITTRILMAITDFASANTMAIIVGLLVVVIGSILYLRTTSGRRMRDKVMLKLPVVGSIVLQSNLALFTRTASTLMAAGVPLTRIMDIVTRTTTNSVVRSAIADVNEGLIQGHGLSKPMATNQLFPPLLVQMVSVGEQTGTLDSSLENVATFYENELDARIDALTSILEPLLTVGIALFVGFIALSVITPMYSVLGSME